MTQDDPAERLRQHLAERYGPGEGPADPSVPPEDEATDDEATDDEATDDDGDGKADETTAAPEQPT